MDMLKQAIESRLPFVQVKTDDLIFVPEVLEAIAGCEVKPLQMSGGAAGQGPSGPQKFAFPEGEVFYTSAEMMTPGFYMQCKSEKKCVVFVNTKASVLPFNGGVMFPPKELMKSYLSALLGGDGAAVEKLLPAFGGMTLKDMFEVTKITVKRTGEVTSKGVNETRQGYISKLKGIVQVETGMSFYDCPNQLKDWVDMNAPFFMEPVSAALTPRGLMFDGPPGTGKTAASKYIAEKLGVPLYRLDIGGMKGKYVGTSEENLNAALAQVDQVEPCVVIFDEIEKVFGETHDSGVTSSMLSSLLWWLQEHKTKVFTVMTTNALGKIPKELYREGRIDETMQFLGLTSYLSAMAFAQEVYANTAETVWKKVKQPDSEMLEQLGATIKMMFESGSAPQSRVTQEVNKMIKAMLVKEKK